MGNFIDLEKKRRDCTGNHPPTPTPPPLPLPCFFHSHFCVSSTPLLTDPITSSRTENRCTAQLLMSDRQNPPFVEDGWNCGGKTLTAGAHANNSCIFILPTSYVRGSMTLRLSFVLWHVPPCVSWGRIQEGFHFIPKCRLVPRVGLCRCHPFPSSRWDLWP